MPRAASRNDSALHRSTHRSDHPIVRGGRLAWHLARASYRPLRALDELLREIERLHLPVPPLVTLRARDARDTGWPYLTDETGEVWR